MTSFPDKSNSEHGTLSVCNSAKIRFFYVLNHCDIW